VAVVLILFTGRDVVHELFHPEAHGSISRGVARVVWRLLRAAAKKRKRILLHAGPVILISVAVTWTALLAVGWALLYYPRMDSAYRSPEGPHEPGARSFFNALYISLAMMTDIGSPEFVPQPGPMRFVAMLEAFTGPILITAWITWVLSIYPVLAERRSFSREVALLRRVEPSAVATVSRLTSTVLAEQLRSLADKLLRIHADLGQSRVTYYFQNPSRDVALAWQLPWVLELGRAAERLGVEPAVRHHGRLLVLTTEAIVAEIGEQFLSLPGAPPDEVLRALAEDHLLADPYIGLRETPPDARATPI
jgi:hypothetical protein